MATTTTDSNGYTIRHGDLCYFWEEEDDETDTKGTEKVKGHFDYYTDRCIWQHHNVWYRSIEQAPEGEPYSHCTRI